MGKSKLEERLAGALRMYGLPEPVREYRFAPPRRYRADFAYIAARLCIEVQGGTFVHGQHSRGVGQSRDYEKHNLLTELGWRVLYYDTKALSGRRVYACVEQIRRVMNL